MENGADIGHFPSIHWTSEIISKCLIGFHLKLFHYIFKIIDIEEKFISFDDIKFKIVYRIHFRFLTRTFQMKFKTTYFSIFFMTSYIQIGNIKVLTLFNTEKSINRTFLNYSFYVKNDFSDFNKIILYYLSRRFLKIFVSQIFFIQIHNISPRLTQILIFGKIENVKNFI